MALPFKTGLKLYSTNLSLIPEIRSLDGAPFDFIELYAMPETYEQTIKHWKGLDASFVIHAAHSHHGVNLARADFENVNRARLAEACRFADALGAQIVVVHGGNSGTFQETLRQIALFGDGRITLENKPKVGVRGNPCVGYLPGEFRQALASGAVPALALDIGHADCAARSLGVDSLEYLREFLALEPILFHLSDRETASEKDVHLNFGKGDLDLEAVLDLIPAGARVTLETPRDPARGLEDFLEDVRILETTAAKRGGRSGRKAKRGVS
jgi:sugar phosphate isomerase/epimerase